MSNTIQISALTGSGIKKLMYSILDLSRSASNEISKKISESFDTSIKEILKKKIDSSIKDLISFSIIGRPNVGKSTIANNFLGRRRMIEYGQPGSTGDSISFPMILDSKKYVLIDTYGLQNKKKQLGELEKIFLKKSIHSIEKSDVILFVIDAKDGVLLQDLRILNFAISKGKPLVILVNKWDQIEETSRKLIKKSISFRIRFILNFVRVHYLSALYERREKEILESIREAFFSSRKRFSRSSIMKIMKQALEKRKPPKVLGKSARFRFFRIEKCSPIKIKIYGNNLEKLPKYYKRFLVKYYTNAMRIKGSEAKIELFDIN